MIPIRPPKIIATAGGVIDRTKVTLGIHGDDLDPDEISALLKCAPTTAHRRGEERSSKERVPARAWKSGNWLLSVEGKSPAEPEALLAALLAKLPEDRTVWQTLGGRFRVRIDFGLFLDAWNRGFELSPQVLDRVAKTGAVLGFDIYTDRDS